MIQSRDLKAVAGRQKVEESMEAQSKSATQILLQGLATKVNRGALVSGEVVGD